MKNMNEIGIVSGGNIEAITITLKEDVELGSFVVVDGGAKYWGTVTDIAHPRIPQEVILAGGMVNHARTTATVDLKRMAFGNEERPIPVKRLLQGLRTD